MGQSKSAVCFTLSTPSYLKVSQLRKFEKSFTVTYTQRTCKIKVIDDNEVYLFGVGGNYTMSEFHLQRKLKNHIHETIAGGKIVPKYTASDIKYSAYSNRILSMPLDEEIKGIQEFDVNKAYYQCAYNLGYITLEMYTKYLNLAKHIRLRFIGTIATSKRKYTYKNGIMEGTVDVIEDAILRDVWFHICHQVDSALLRFKELSGEHFLMYYVDGIYLDDTIDCEPILKQIKEEFGFDFKKSFVESMRLTHNNQDRHHCYQIIIRKYDEDEKEYKDKPFTIKTPKQYEDDTYGSVIQTNLLKKA